jgi:hypothetical protein
MENHNEEISGKMRTLIVIGSIFGAILISELLKWLINGTN